MEGEIGGFKAELQNSVVMCCIDMELLRHSYVSYSNLFLMMEIAGSTGTDVKRTYISWDVIHSPSPCLMDFTLSTKSWMFLMWLGECTTNGLKMKDNS